MKKFKSNCNTLCKEYNSRKDIPNHIPIQIHRPTIKIKKVSRDTIDIHRINKKELNLYLLKNIQFILNTKQFKIICGRGLHSDNGSVLKPIILEFCKKHHLLYKIDSRGGRIITNP
jgi:hypothetical protein